MNNNKVLFLATMLLSQVSNGSVTQYKKPSFSKMITSSINALPERYHILEYFKVYSLFAASFLNRSSIGMLQFYKHYVYGKEFGKQLPKEVVSKIFDYLNPSFFIIKLDSIDKSINAPAIRQKLINSLLPENFSSFDIVPQDLSDGDSDWRSRYLRENLFPFSFQRHDCQDWIIRITTKPSNCPFDEYINEIAQLQKYGLLYLTLFSFKRVQTRNDILEINFDDPNTYNVFKSFNNHRYLICTVNKIADYMIEYRQFRSMFGPVSDHKVEYALPVNMVKNSVIICDTKNNNMEVKRVEFNGYIRAAFCLDPFLVVELIDETLEKPGTDIQPETHARGTSFPSNHRIEIYSLETKNKLYGIGLPLIRPYQFNIFSYSLFFVDADNIYLYDHARNIYVALPYKNCSVKELMNDSDDFFITQLIQDSNTTQCLKYLSNEETLLNRLFQQRKNFKNSSSLILLMVLIGLLTQFRILADSW